MEAVVGFEPKQGVSDPLWEIHKARVSLDLNVGAEKVTPLFKE
jgi:hypothetical protein